MERNDGSYNVLFTLGVVIGVAFVVWLFFSALLHLAESGGDAQLCCATFIICPLWAVIRAIVTGG